MTNEHKQQVASQSWKSWAGWVPVGQAIELGIIFALIGMAVWALGKLN